MSTREVIARELESLPEGDLAARRRKHRGLSGGTRERR